MKMELKVNKTEKAIEVIFPDHAQKVRLLKILADKAVKWSFTFILMKMIVTSPSAVYALSTYNALPAMQGGPIYINYQDQDDAKRICNELGNIAKEMNGY